MGGGIWTGWMLSSIVCHVGGKKRRKMSDSRYRAGLAAYKRKKRWRISAGDEKLWACSDWVVGKSGLTIVRVGFVPPKKDSS